MNRTAQIVERIAASEIYKDYESAFSEATRLPIAFRAAEGWRLGLERAKSMKTPSARCSLSAMGRALLV